MGSSPAPRYGPYPYTTGSVTNKQVDRFFLGHVQDMNRDPNIKDDDEQKAPSSLLTVSANNRGEGLLVATNAFEISPRSDAIRAQRAAELNRDTIMAEAKQKADRLRDLKRPSSKLNKYSILPKLDENTRQKMIEEAEVEAQAAKTAIAPALRQLERAKQTLKQAETLDCIQTEWLQIEYVLLHEYKICQSEIPDLHPMDFLNLHDQFWDWQFKKLRYAKLLDRRGNAFEEWAPILELEGRRNWVATKLRSSETVKGQMMKRLAEHGVKKEEKGDDEATVVGEAIEVVGEVLERPVDAGQPAPISTQVKTGEGRQRKDSLVDIVGLRDSDDEEMPVQKSSRKKRRRIVEDDDEPGPLSKRGRPLNDNDVDETSAGPGQSAPISAHGKTGNAHEREFSPVDVPIPEIPEYDDGVSIQENEKKHLNGDESQHQPGSSSKRGRSPEVVVIANTLSKFREGLGAKSDWKLGERCK